MLRLRSTKTCPTFDMPLVKRPHLQWCCLAEKFSYGYAHLMVKQELRSCCRSGAFSENHSLGFFAKVAFPWAHNVMDGTIRLLVRSCLSPDFSYDVLFSRYRPKCDAFGCSWEQETSVGYMLRHDALMLEKNKKLNTKCDVSVGLKPHIIAFRFPLCGQT